MYVANWENKARKERIYIRYRFNSTKLNCLLKTTRFTKLQFRKHFNALYILISIHLYVLSNSKEVKAHQQFSKSKIFKAFSNHFKFQIRCVGHYIKRFSFINQKSRMLS